VVTRVKEEETHGSPDPWIGRVLAETYQSSSSSAKAGWEESSKRAIYAYATDGLR